MVHHVRIVTIQYNVLQKNGEAFVGSVTDSFYCLCDSDPQEEQRVLSGDQRLRVPHLREQV